MTYRLTPALLAILLAGCSTPEPQNVSYAPVATSVAPLPPPAQPGAAPVYGQSVQPAYGQTAQPTAPAVYGQPGQPALNGQAMQSPPGEFAQAPAFQHTPTCNTVDGVTLCDAAVDPNEPDRLYTN